MKLLSRFFRAITSMFALPFPKVGEVFKLEAKCEIFERAFKMPNSCKNCHISNHLIAGGEVYAVKLVKFVGQLSDEAKTKAYLPWEVLVAFRNQHKIGVGDWSVTIVNDSVSSETIFPSGAERWPLRLYYSKPDRELVAYPGWAAGDTYINILILVPADFDEKLLQ